MDNYSIGIICGIICALFVCVLAKVYIRRRLKMDQRDYDERQIAVQGSAYKYAYLTLLIVVFLGALCVSAFDLTVKPLTLICLCAMLSLAVFVSICILRDAYFTCKTRKPGVFILFLALGVVNLIGGIRLLTDHACENAWISLSVAFLMLYIGALMIVKNIRERGREDE